jgi:hypothetical protein
MCPSLLNPNPVPIPPQGNSRRWLSAYVVLLAARDVLIEEGLDEGSVPLILVAADSGRVVA